MVEVGRMHQEHYDFLYDSEVGTKFRGTTYYKTKKWTKKEDLLLISLHSRYKNNWQIISEKLANKRTMKEEPKTDLDCSRRWHMINKIHCQESDSEHSLTVMDVTDTNLNTSTK